MRCDIKLVGSEKIMYVKHVRTTLLNNKSTSTLNNMATMEFQKIDKIIYVDADGTEEVMWKNTEAYIS